MLPWRKAQNENEALKISQKGYGCVSGTGISGGVGCIDKTDTDYLIGYEKSDEQV